MLSMAVAKRVMAALVIAAAVNGIEIYSNGGGGCMVILESDDVRINNESTVPV